MDIWGRTAGSVCELEMAATARRGAEINRRAQGSESIAWLSTTLELRYPFNRTQKVGMQEHGRQHSIKVRSDVISKTAHRSHLVNCGHIRSVVFVIDATPPFDERHR
jgi:hypothetical protein